MLRNILLMTSIAMMSGPVDTASAAEGKGSLCLAPLPERVEKEDLGVDGRPWYHEYIYDFSVSVDDGEPVKIAKGKAGVIGGIALGKRHRMRIFDGRKTIESFRFTFEEYRAKNLCLTYTTGHQTWQLWDIDEPGRRAWCMCPDMTKS